MIPLQFGYANLELNNFSTFEEKLSAINAYLEINSIFCRLAEEQISERTFFDKYNVIEVLVPGGQASYIKLLLQEAMVFLQHSLDDFITSEEDYYSIRKILENSKDKCVYLSKKNNIQKSLFFHDNEISCIVIMQNGKWNRLYFDQLEFEQNVRNQLHDQFSIRKEFYQECIEMIDKKLKEHLEMPSFPKMPYKWNSDRAHLEIAELLHALVSTKIEIKEGGSPAKFIKQFYNLFGLDDTPYHAKMQQVRNRSGKQSWLQILPDYINSLQERNQVPKKKP